jgi:hypothetical protein
MAPTHLRIRRRRQCSDIESGTGTASIDGRAPDRLDTATDSGSRWASTDGGSGDCTGSIIIRNAPGVGFGRRQLFQSPNDGTGSYLPQTVINVGPTPTTAAQPPPRMQPMQTPVQTPRAALDAFHRGELGNYVVYLVDNHSRPDLNSEPTTDDTERDEHSATWPSTGRVGRASGDRTSHLLSAELLWRTRKYLIRARYVDYVNRCAS